MANNTSTLCQMGYDYPWFSGAHLATREQGKMVAESYLLGVRLRERAYGRRALLKEISAEEFARPTVATAKVEDVATDRVEVSEVVESGVPEITELMAPEAAEIDAPEEGDSTLSLIDDFISSGDHHRIVIGEQTTEESMATFGGETDDEDDFVSEELAEIYAKQGLFDDAIAIYRKLSLQDLQKSVYFAELIGQLCERKAQEGEKKDK